MGELSVDRDEILARLLIQYAAIYGEPPTKAIFELLKTHAEVIADANRAMNTALAQWFAVDPRPRLDATTGRIG